MSKNTFFVDRRRGRDRRLDADPCKNLPVDLYHRKRRKSTDRRAPERSLIEDYYAFLDAGMDAGAGKPQEQDNKPRMQ